MIYFCFMMVGAAIVRVPAPGWAPGGLCRAGRSRSKLITTENVYVYEALKTPQFWLIWWVLCLNVTAGIGVLGQASAMSQEMFPGRITAGRRVGLRRADEPVQHGRPFLLGVDVRLSSAARTPISCSSSSAPCSMRSCPIPARSAASPLFVLCLCRSSSACMAAAFRPCRPISGTCSARAMSAPSMACC